MAEKYIKNQNRVINDQVGESSLIGLYEMLSQSENDVNSEYSSIIDKIEELSKSVNEE